MSKRVSNRSSRKKTMKKTSKKLQSLFDIEKSINYKRALFRNFQEILSYKTSSNFNLLKKKDYPEELLNFLNILTTQEKYQMKGTYTFEDQFYPLDVDILEYIYVNMDKIKKKDPKECYWLADRISNLVIKLQLKYPDIIFVEFKAGYDRRY